MSSRERLFSEAKTDREGRGPGAAADEKAELLDAEVEVVIVVSNESDERILVTVEAELDAEAVRMWGYRKGLGS